MKSIFRTIALLAVLSCALSCQLLEDLYVRLPNTSWTLEVDSQRAFVYFSDERSSVLQRNISTGAVQVLNGSYSAEGHAAVVSGDNGNSVKFIRTFSHLKSSGNKNFSSLRTKTVQTLDNTLFLTLEKNNFHVLYFNPSGDVRKASFKNVVREEGVPYGWEGTTMPFQVSGSQVSWGEERGVLFPEVMLVDDVWYFHYPINQDEGNSRLCGTMWTYRTNGYPGILVFDTNSSFTRILLSSNVLCYVFRGTYSLEGDVLTMTLDGKQERCPLGTDSFTFMEKTYVLFE